MRQRQSGIRQCWYKFVRNCNRTGICREKHVVATFAIKVKLCETHMRESLKLTERHCYIHDASLVSLVIIIICRLSSLICFTFSSLYNPFFIIIAQTLYFSKRKKNRVLSKASLLLFFSTSTPLSFRHCLKSN